MKRELEFLISGLPSHVDFGAHPSPTAAVLPNNKQRKWPKIFAVNLLGLTSFSATGCQCFWRASKITIALKLKLTVKEKIADNS